MKVIKPYIISAMLFLLGTGVGVGIVLYARHVREAIHLSLFRTQGAELWNAYRLWVEAGRPSGTDRQQFAEGLKQWHWELVEKSLVVDGREYRTLFCDPDLQPYRRGALYVTTNGVVLWECGSEVVSEKELP